MNNQQALGRQQPFVTVQSPPIIAQRAPASSDTRYPKGATWLDESPATPVMYEHLGGGVWESNNLTLSTDATFAAASNSTASSSLAIKTYADALAIAGAPVATVSTSGIGRLVSDANAVARLASTGAQAYFITPTNLTAVLAAPGAIGGTTPAAGTFTNLAATGVGTGNILTSNTASNFSTTGAGIDATIDSASGRVVINAEEAAANAITLLSAAGGLDVDVALQMNLASSQNAASAIVISASAGGIDMTAAGAPAEDIDITCTAGSIRIVAGESAVDSIVISSTIGGIDITAAGAAAGEDIDISAVGSSVNISASENAGDAITINASAGGIDITNTGTAGEDIDIASSGASVNISSTENAALSVYLHANGGVSETIRLRSDQGTGANSIELISDVGGFLAQTGLSGANAIYLHADGGVAETIKIHSDQGTGVASVEVASDVGGVTISSGLANADAINLTASNAAGGVDVNCGSAGFIVDAAAGPISLDGALASNFNVTGAGVDIDIGSASGRLILTSGEDAADSIYLHANAGVSETIRIHSDQGTGVASVEVASDVGGITLLSGLASADAINLTATSGGVDIDGALQINIASSQVAASAIVINASNAAGGIDISTGGGSIDVSSSGFVTMVAGANTVAGDTATVNTNVFAATYTDFTTAAAGVQVFNIANSLVTSTSQVMLTVSNLGANDAKMTLERVLLSAGNIACHTQNNGAAALNGNVVITGWVLA